MFDERLVENIAGAIFIARGAEKMLDVVDDLHIHGANGLHPFLAITVAYIYHFFRSILEGRKLYIYMFTITRINMTDAPAPKRQKRSKPLSKFELKLTLLARTRFIRSVVVVV